MFGPKRNRGRPRSVSTVSVESGVGARKQPYKRKKAPMGTEKRDDDEEVKSEEAKEADPKKTIKESKATKHSQRGGKTKKNQVQKEESKND